MGVWATRQRSVLRACEILGDEVALARHLGIPVVEVVDWILGDVTVPAEHFLRVVDIILVDNRKLVEQNRDFIAEMRQKYRRSDQNAA